MDSCVNHVVTFVCLIQRGVSNVTDDRVPYTKRSERSDRVPYTKRCERSINVVCPMGWERRGTSCARRGVTLSNKR